MGGVLWHNLFHPAVLLMYPVYILLMAGVLRLCGVEKAEIAKWALKQAGRQRFTDLLTAARGLLPDKAPPSLGRTPESPATRPLGDDDRVRLTPWLSSTIGS